jgi:hypothetical protein
MRNTEKGLWIMVFFGGLILTSAFAALAENTTNDNGANNQKIGPANYMEPHDWSEFSNYAKDMNVMGKTYPGGISKGSEGEVINASHVMNLTDNETSYVEEIVDNHINSSGINLTNYTLKVVTIAFFMDEKKLVDVFLIPETPGDKMIKFTVDLNSGEVIKRFIKPKPNFFMRSKQDMSQVRDALMIANNDSEIKRNFALMNFKRVPHIQPYNGNMYHLTFMPMNFCERMERGLPPQPQGFDERCNLTVVDVNVSMEDKRVLGFGPRRMFLNKKLENQYTNQDAR